MLIITWSLWMARGRRWGCEGDSAGGMVAQLSLSGIAPSELDRLHALLRSPAPESVYECFAGMCMQQPRDLSWTAWLAVMPMIRLVCAWLKLRRIDWFVTLVLRNVRGSKCETVRNREEMPASQEHIATTRRCI